MANLRDVRIRMKAIAQTLQVTKAMKLISTAKLRKSRRTLEDSHTFFEKIRKSMTQIVAHAEVASSEYFDLREKNEIRRSGVIVITTDRGLAGGYNANVARYTETLCAGLPSPFLMLVGAIGQRYFDRSPYPVLENFSFNSKLPQVHDAKEISDFIISQFSWGMFDEIYIVYTRMRNSISLVPESIRLLPLDSAKLHGKDSPFVGENRKVVNYEYLPSAEGVFNALVPLYIKGVVYGALVEAYAAEQSGRITAMDEASKNAETMLWDLRLAYNRARQAMITQEVSEIVAGAEAQDG